MRILVLWDFYPNALRAYYASHAPTGLDYETLYRHMIEDAHLSWPPYLVPHLNGMGHDAHLIVGNSEPLQRAWAYHYDRGAHNSGLALIERQIRYYQPDVLWVTGLPYYLGSLLQHSLPKACVVVAWMSYNVSPALDLSRINAIATSFPHFVEHYSALGIPTHYMLPCFEPRLLHMLGPRQPTRDATFVGSLTADFVGRARSLGYVGQHTPLAVYGEGPQWSKRFWSLKRMAQSARVAYAVRKMRLYPASYGVDMFRLLHISRIVFNTHIDAARGVASNMRMFEATGVGALLVTEDAPNLAQLFEPGREVVAYTSEADAADKIGYYLSHPEECEAIAYAGQQRTLRNYTPEIRARQLIEVIEQGGR